MKLKTVLLMAMMSIVVLAKAADKTEAPRQRIMLDPGWKFLLGDPAGARGVAFNDAAWRAVDLPHDWSIEGAIAPDAPMGGGGGFFPAGIGWYRRVFDAPADWKGRRVAVEFEGVYMNSDVWINGRHLGTHPYGYTGFFHDLTDGIKFGAKNTLAVRVDQSKHKNTRWYSGSGIYRHVWLHVTPPLRIAPWGVTVATPEVSAEKATVVVKTKIIGEGRQPRALTLRTGLFTYLGVPAGKAESSCDLPAGASRELTQTIEVAKPALWSPDIPALYCAVTDVLVDRRLVDQVVTPFGIRSLAWSAEKGLLLNGKSIELCGGCVHHDNGCLGAAAFDRAEVRRVELLKAAGFNAIRTAHNPPSPAFLDACDRLGMLVMDEAFDCWEKGKNPHDYGEVFVKWWRRDIDAMVLRDRNHPSVFCWSIGNETPQRADALELTKSLVAAVKANDPTRPVAEAICDFWDFKGRKWPETDSAFALVDLAGYNYTLPYEEDDHARAPGRVMVCTESHPSAVFDIWRRVTDRPYIIGDFVWTALDYLGEAGIGRTTLQSDTDNGHGKETLYPWHGSYCGDLDLTGLRKPVSHYRNIVWDRGEKLCVAVLEPAPAGKKWRPTPWGLPPAHESWTWPGQDGKPLGVEVYSRCDRVRLFLNEKLIGEKATTRAEEFKAVFEVPYAPGTLKAVGLTGNLAPVECALKTAGGAAAIALKPDRAAITADGQDLSFVTVEVTDAAGRRQPNAANTIEFALSGPGKIAGLDNGDTASLERYQGNRRSAWRGRALVVIRSARQPGEITLTAQSPGLKTATIPIKAN